MNESFERSMNTSSELSDDKAFCNTMDEDILNYLSTLTPQQQKYLDDFVSISEHKIVTPMPAIDSSCLPKFAYGNSVGANYFYGRPMSVYEPFVPPESEFSSLPPDLVSSNDPNVMYDPMNIAAKYWEAEDAEYIETLNEMQDNVGQQSTNNYDDTRLPTVMETIADIHYSEDKTNDTHIYAVVQKNRKQPENLMVASDRSASDPPREKFPKIMTQSCYGELNNPTELIWNCYEQDLVNSMENVTEDGSHQIISSLMTDSSIIDGISSMNSSIYEQIPSMTSSIEMQMTMPRSTAAINQRKIVKWWDDREYTEESTLDLHGTAEEVMEFTYRFLILQSQRNISNMQPETTLNSQSYF